MREPSKVNDELRQLKLMSKGLRAKAMRSLMARHAAKRAELEKPPVVAPRAKIQPPVAA